MKRRSSSSAPAQAPVPSSHATVPARAPAGRLPPHHDRIRPEPPSSPSGPPIVLPAGPVEAAEHITPSPALPWQAPGYYGLPAVKHSHYRWTVGSSLFAAGLAGATQLMTTLLDFTGDGAKAPLVRAGRYTALAASVAAPALYVKDLGTPSRWFNMMRIVRPTSLMSLGSWSLAMLGGWTALAAAGQAARDLGLPRAGNAIAKSAGVPAAAIGSFVSVYMGPELEETSTPLWAHSSPLLSVLFALSNASNALSVFELAAWSAGPRTPLSRRIGLLNGLVSFGELVTLRLVERKWTHPQANSAPRSHESLLYRTGAVALGKVASIVARAGAMAMPSRAFSLLPVAAASGLLSGYFLPIALLFSGNRSANRPGDYFQIAAPGRDGQPDRSTEAPSRTRIGRHRRKRTFWRAAAITAAAAAAAIVGTVVFAARAPSKDRRSSIGPWPSHARP